MMSKSRKSVGEKKRLASYQRKDVGATYNSAPARKSRMKDAKESRLAIEKVAKKIIHEDNANLNQRMENFCMDIINKRFTDLRQDVVIMESSLSSRIAQMEYRMNDMNTRLTEVSTDVVRQNTLLREELAAFAQQFNTGLDNERNKRLSAIKKLQSLAETHTEHSKSMLGMTNSECMAAVATLNEDFKVQSKEIARLKENVEGMLMKRYGFLPNNKAMSDNLASSFNQGLDAGVVLDNLSTRLQNLESIIAEDELGGCDGGVGLNASFQHSNSPLRSLSGGSNTNNNNNNTIGRRLRNNKMRQLEDYIFEMRGQVQHCESEIEVVKNTVLSRGIGLPVNSGNGNSHTGSEANAYTHTEMKQLQKKLKKLAENTTRACRSLSNGLTDVQQATLNLYTWADGAHDCFGKISHELGMGSNMCSRARVYKPAVVRTSTTAGSNGPLGGDGDLDFCADM